MPVSTLARSPALVATGSSVLPWWKDLGLRKLIFWQSWILTAQIIVGYDESNIGSLQSIQPWQDAMGNPSDNMLGLITCSLYIGGLVGAIFAASIADRFGRRVAIQVGSILEFIGSVLQAAAPNRDVFIGARVIIGFGISFTTTAGPNLLTELSHPRLRGKIVPSYNVFWYAGSIIASWLTFGTGHMATQWSWRIPSIVQAIFPLLLLVPVNFMPESPRWLYSRGRREEARRVIIKYHANGNEADAVAAIEIEEIATALQLEEESKMYTWGSLIKSKANLQRLGIALTVSLGCLWNGQGLISYYFSPMLDSVGITSTNKQTGINGGMSIWNLLCSILGVFLADKIGRRPLWMISFVAMIFANVPLTISSAMYKQHGTPAAAYIAVVSMFLYNGAFNIACNPLAYSYVPEIMPYSIRSKGVAFQILTSQIALMINQYVNPIAIDNIGYWYYVFYLGMLFLFLGIIFSTFPETRGLTLEELGILFDDGIHSRPGGVIIIEGQEQETGSAECSHKGTKKEETREV